MEAITKRWPKILVQFEDFNTELAFDLLEIHRNKYTCFNDDVRRCNFTLLTIRSKELHLSFSVALSMQFADQDSNLMTIDSCFSEQEVLEWVLLPC